MPSSAKLRNGTGSPGATASISGPIATSPWASTIEVRMPEPSRAIRWAMTSPFGPGWSRARRYSLRPARFRQRKSGWDRETCGRAPGEPGEAEQDGPGEQEEADHGGDGIARKADEHRVAEPAERQRPAGLHRDLPEVEPTVALDGADNVVLVAARRTAGGEDDMVAGGRTGEDSTDLGRIVGCDPEVRNFSRQRLEQSPENGAVGVVDAPLGKHGAGLQQLVAGRQQGYSQRRVDGEGGPAQLGSEPDILWT